MKVCYSGYLGAQSGMGEAARNIISSLYLAGVDVTTEDIPNITSKANLGMSHDISSSLLGKFSDYKVRILHITPDLILKYLEPLKYHIMDFYWETDRLPKWWVWNLNLLQEIWTGDEYHAEVFRKSGVTTHIWVKPQPIDTSISKADPVEVPGHKGYLFYSIFQWIERKNPKALLTAYWKEFSGVKNVGLLLKTYKEYYTMEEGMLIKKEIEQWKKELSLDHFPPVYLYPCSLDKRDVFRIHSTGDCFVSAHRGEGWGIPIGEALLMGKPVVTTKNGGITEYLDDGQAVLLPWKPVPVFGMDFVPWYDSTQNWAEVDEQKLREGMRWCYEHQEEAKQMGKRGKQFILDNFNYLRIGNMMKDRLETIENDVIKINPLYQ